MRFTPRYTVNSRNPWRRLPDKPPFILAEDKDAVMEFNKQANEKGHPHALNLQIIPVPFGGRPNAPLVLLGNISGAGDEHMDDYKKWPKYADRMRKNLLHENVDFQFLPFGPDPIPGHKEWWARTLRHLLKEDYGNGDTAENTLARSILAVDFFPYRSCSNEYHQEKLSLMSSQGYSRVLVFNAMENGAVIVIRYGRERWFDAVRGLRTYQHLVLLWEARRTHISPKGVETPNGYKKIVDKIKASAVTRGKGV
jgi:hypothetical protein